MDFYSEYDIMPSTMLTDISNSSFQLHNMDFGSHVSSYENTMSSLFNNSASDTLAYSTDIPLTSTNNGSLSSTTISLDDFSTFDNLNNHNDSLNNYSEFNNSNNYLSNGSLNTSNLSNSQSSRHSSGNQLEVPVSQSPLIGGLSPASESGYNSGRVSSSSGSQWSPASCQESYLVSAAETLNNHGAAAYHNSLNASFEHIPSNTFEPKIETSDWGSTYADTSFETQFMAHTPTPTPIPDNDTLPPEEPSLLLMQSLSLQNETPSRLPSYQEARNSTCSLYVEDNYPPYNSMMPSPASGQQSQQQTNHYYPGQNSSQFPSTSWTSQQKQRRRRAPTQAEGEQSSLLRNSHSDEDDTLNIPREQLLQPEAPYNIQQLIRADLESTTSIPSTSSAPRSDNLAQREQHIVSADPRLWNTDDIRNWLVWCHKEVSTTQTICADQLPATGAELCQLSRENFHQMVGKTDGDKLANHLNCILGSQGTSLPENNDNLDAYELYRSMCTRLSCPGSGQIQLWQFILEKLADRSNEKMITWENKNGEFKIMEPDELARQWGERKTKPNMNYDKLSRALRYYYDRRLMLKVSGKRYAYRVCFENLETLHSVQQGSEPKPAIDYNLISMIDSALSPASTHRSAHSPSHTPSQTPSQRATDTPSPMPFFY